MGWGCRWSPSSGDAEREAAPSVNELAQAQRVEPVPYVALHVDAERRIEGGRAMFFQTVLVSLIAIASESDHPEWLALTPEGYADGSDKLVAQARWRINGQEVPAAMVWNALRQPALVAGSLRGEALTQPKFEKN